MLLLSIMFSFLCSSGVARGASRIGRANIPFKGKATGGTLVLGYAPSPHYVCLYSVSIDTSPGEAAESVAARLATAVVSSGAIFEMRLGNAAPGRAAMCTAQGGTLSIVGSIKSYIFAGTEKGLAIPKPPLSLSCAYDNQTRTIEVRWVNPQDEFGYDSVYIHWRYRSMPADTPLSGGAKIITGKPMSHTIEVPQEVNDLDVDVWVKGLRHDLPVSEMLSKDIPLSRNSVPSNITAIHLTGGGYCQEEADGIPFSFGVAPNWTGWSSAGDTVDKAAFKQGEKYPGARWYKPVAGLLAKPLYQIIKAPRGGAAHGVYREFLGLTPGHTYRLSGSLSTLNMDSMQGNWSLALCAIALASGGESITPDQLAGTSPLPDGRSGPDAGRIAVFSRGYTTKNEFKIVISRADAQNPLEGSNITLPSGAGAIAVWVRFESEDPKGMVGLSGVRLEDLTAISNPKSSDQILAEEAEKEEQFLRHIEKALRLNR